MDTYYLKGGLEDDLQSDKGLTICLLLLQVTITESEFTIMAIKLFHTHLFTWMDKI